MAIDRNVIKIDGVFDNFCNGIKMFTPLVAPEEFKDSIDFSVHIIATGLPIFPDFVYDIKCIYHFYLKQVEQRADENHAVLQTSNYNLKKA